MSEQLGDIDTFARLCRAGASAAARRERPVLVSSTCEAPGFAVGERLRLLGDRASRTFAWASSWSGERRLAVGTARDMTARGSDRFRRISEAWNRCVDGALVEGTGFRPSAVGGFNFTPQQEGRRGVMPDALMWLPAAQLTQKRDEIPVLTLNAWIQPTSRVTDCVRSAAEALQMITAGSDDGCKVQSGLVSVCDTPSPVEWKALVRKVLQAIEVGEFDKLVLARQLVAEFDEPVTVPPLLAHLFDTHEIGASFGAQLGDGWFLGRTPECLLHVHGECVESHGLAGSVPRDPDPAHDAELARRLQTHPRLVSEHAIVADFVAQSLQKFFRDVRSDTDQPVLKLADVQHRQTLIKACHPIGPVDLLNLAAELHPTPAMGGLPRAAALRWLDSHEPFDRGWYAAPIGWVGADGGGELAVAIRSGTIRGSTATLYAGCGIVAGADPDEEYAESCMKMRSMSRVLGINNDVLSKI